MDYSIILEKQKIFKQGRNKIDSISISSYEKDFELIIIGGILI